MNNEPPPSYEKVFGDNIQPPKYEENSREEFTTRIDIQNESQTSESESVRRNQALHGTVQVPSQNVLESILENQQRQLRRQEKKDREKEETFAAVSCGACCGAILIIIFFISLALYAHFHG